MNKGLKIVKAKTEKKKCQNVFLLHFSFIEHFYTYVSALIYLQKKNSEISLNHLRLCVNFSTDPTALASIIHRIAESHFGSIVFKSMCQL